MDFIKLLIGVVVIVFSCIGLFCIIFIHFSDKRSKKKADHFEQYMKENFPEARVHNEEYENKR